MVANASPMPIGFHFSVNVPSNAQEIFVKTVIVSNIDEIPTICMRISLSVFIDNMHVKCVFQVFQYPLYGYFFTMSGGNVPFRARKIHELLLCINQMRDTATKCLVRWAIDAVVQSRALIGDHSYLASPTQRSILTLECFCRETIG